MTSTEAVVPGIVHRVSGPSTLLTTGELSHAQHFIGGRFRAGCHSETLAMVWTR